METFESKLSNLSPNYWRQINIQFKNPGKIYSSSATIVPIIEYIRSKFPTLEFEEACYLVKNKLDDVGRCLHCKQPVEFRPANKAEPYKKFCCSSCRNIFSSNPAAEQIIAAGKLYRDFPAAIKELNLKRTEIRRRIFSLAFPDYRWAQDHEKTCIEKITRIDPRLLDTTFMQSWEQSDGTFSGLAKLIGKNVSTILDAMAYLNKENKYSQINCNAVEVKTNKQLLAQLYTTFTTEEIAQQLLVTAKTVQNWLHYHDIPVDQSKSQSAIEREFSSYIRDNWPDTVVEERNKTVLNGVELDLYFPDHKLAIEFDGLRYHSELPTKANRHRHSYKQKLCYKNGIQLLNFTDVGETILAHKKDIVRSIIASKLGKCNRIYARHCELVEVAGREANMFFNSNHISGNRPASRYIGLRHSGELVMVMSFGKPIVKSPHRWEIVRMASKKFITVVGGASRIFKEFLRTSSGTVMSYANLRFGNGSVYRRLGFNFVKITEPGYVYTDLNRIYARQQFRKNTIAKICPRYDPGLTEAQNAENNNFRVYWDTGHLLFEFLR